MIALVFFTTDKELTSTTGLVSIGLLATFLILPFIYSSCLYVRRYRLREDDTKASILQLYTSLNITTNRLKQELPKVVFFYPALFMLRRTCFIVFHIWLRE